MSKEENGPMSGQQTVVRSIAFQEQVQKVQTLLDNGYGRYRTTPLNNPGRPVMPADLVLKSKNRK